jgi:serralysin
MSFFQGNNNDNTAIAGSTLDGFTGSIAETTDNSDDTYDAGDGNDFVQAGNTNDLLLGGRGDDHLKGGGGDDALLGGSGLDNLEGGDGNDTFFMTEGQFIDDVNGGTGIDTLDLTDITSFGANVNLAASTYNSDPFFGTRSINGIEVVLGTRNTDTVNGGAANETITGNGGIDVLNGGDGDDRFIMTEGSSIDDVNGGNGFDTLDLSNISRLLKNEVFESDFLDVCDGNECAGGQ